MGLRSLKNLSSSTAAVLKTVSATCQTAEVIGEDVDSNSARLEVAGFRIKCGMTAGWGLLSGRSKVVVGIASLDCCAEFTPYSDTGLAMTGGDSGARLVMDSGKDGAVSFEDAVEMFISFS